MKSTGTKPAPTKLLQEFPSVSYDQWRKLVDTELKGAPFEKKMFSSTYEGIQLQPIYRREDISSLPHVNSFPGFAPFVRGTRASGNLSHGWDISQEITTASPAEFNNSALNYITRGLTALNMVLDHATRDGHDPDWAKPEQVGAGGLSIATLQDLDKALEGIDLDKTTLLVRCGASGMPFGALLAALARKRKKALPKLRGCIETDPLGVLSHEGKLPQSLDAAYREMTALTQWAARNAPALQTACVHTRAWHDAGANAVQELAFGVATGLEYVRAVAARGVEVEQSAPRIRFAVSVGVNYFMEIAKIRALRMLWARLIQALDGSEAAQRLSLHIRTSRWNKTTYDPYNNLLRTTVEAFAGVIGACDSMQVGAFDEVIRPPDDFSQRIARNTQLILLNECSLNQVIDPAGGSWYIENLTSELAQRAWGLFQEVEKMGGMEAAMRQGFPQKTVADTAAEKLKAVARRRDSIVGVNQYANPIEKPLERTRPDNQTFYRRRVQQIATYRTEQDEEASQAVLQKLARIVEATDAGLFDACIEAAQAGATLGEITRSVRISDAPCEPITPVCITRLSTGFERLRDAAERFASRNGGQAPQAFLCNMGSLKEHRARADFARGFLSAGGYDVISPEGFKTPEAAAEAFARTEARLAVICSTDDNYPALVPALVKELRQKKLNAIIVLAGYPQDQVETYKKQGIDQFIHIRADALATLAEFHSRLGID